MATITAIYEIGVFRPVGPVDLPEGSKVRVEIASPPDADITDAGMSAEQAAIYEVLSRRYDSGHRDTAERHNEHQP